MLLHSYLEILANGGGYFNVSLNKKNLSVVKIEVCLCLFTDLEIWK